MSNRLTSVLIGFAVLLFLGYFSTFVVNERQQAVVLRFNEIHDVKSEPGIYFKLPFPFMQADRVQYIEKRALRLDYDNIRAQVSGGKFYEVDAFLVYRITDARRFLMNAGDQESAELRLRTRLDASLRRVYGLRGFESALSDARASMMQEVRDDLRPDAESLGLSIVDVRIRRTDLTQEVSLDTFKRMRSERLAEAELIRARGNEEAQRRRAIADRQVVELESDASRQSEVLRGEGDAERNRIFGEAFQRDPSFFEFYRSMSAYASALTGTGTTLVLSPDSPFFRYFNDINGASPRPTPPAAPAAPAN
ncbi:Modulator of FtsH protease HflC [Agrobacterium sp. DSM 25558]|uniref:Protein HflC n=1 Tax=Agrobacterium rosae TaxID=1972867 RepID=A0AAW9F776_9HYPH|nr:MULTISPECIES: protease modulator HflC [Agrobacterium]MDX8301350.1 protease modulator HflC [Agrobacterium rosae]POO57754.1 protease modulator HflC [Agrobacterium rosae]SCX30394.1 Modulator of FtsH protease HflC [Agrobacterium sp. DSM 25558]